MNAERLEELATLVNRRFPNISARLPSGTQILHVRSREEGPRFVVWRPNPGAYVWYSDPGHGKHLGTTADQAANEIARTLDLTTQ